MKRLLLALACFSISGTVLAGMQDIKVAIAPAQLANKPIALISERPRKDEVAPRAVEVENKSTFFRQNTGGSFLMGLLLGPIGAAGNMSNIDRITAEKSKDGTVSSLFQLDAQEIATEAYSEAVPATRKGDAQSAILIQPYVVYYIFDEAIGVESAVAFRVTGTIDGQSEKWRANYMYYFDGAVLPNQDKPLSSDQLATQRAKLKKGFVELFKALQTDVDGKAPQKQDIASARARGLQMLGGVSLGSVAMMIGNVSRDETGRMVLKAMWGRNNPPFSEAVFESDSLYQFREPPVAREKSD